MNPSFERHIQQVFESAMTAAEMAAISSNAHNSNADNKSVRGYADIVVINASERLLNVLGKYTKIVEAKPGLWVLGEFTRQLGDFALFVKEAAVDAALQVLSDGIDEADGQFRAPSWVE
ncbi:hypothetical protein ACXX81_13120 [Pseudomonas sp. GNP013]